MKTTMKEVEFTKFRQNISRMLERVTRTRQPICIVRAGEWLVDLIPTTRPEKKPQPRRKNSK
jgi:PHD/YefM family antitoxin component YafN of YafNO toxin-antitoxin module